MFCAQIFGTLSTGREPQFGCSTNAMPEGDVHVLAVAFTVVTDVMYRPAPVAHAQHGQTPNAQVVERKPCAAIQMMPS